MQVANIVNPEGRSTPTHEAKRSESDELIMHIKLLVATMCSRDDQHLTLSSHPTDDKKKAPCGGKSALYRHVATIYLTKFRVLGVTVVSHRRIPSRYLRTRDSLSSLSSGLGASMDTVSSSICEGCSPSEPSVAMLALRPRTFSPGLR